MFRPGRDYLDWVLRFHEPVVARATSLFDWVCFFCGRWVVRYIRLWFALFWQPYHYLYMTRARSGMHWDGKMYGEGIQITRHVRYSSKHALETLDIIQPSTPPSEPRTPIVYIHGGAFIA